MRYVHQTLLVIMLAAGTSSAGLSTMLPLGRGMVGDRDLPKPLGAGFNVHYQEQDYQLVSLGLSVPGGAAPVDIAALASAADLSIENSVLEVHVAMDAWILPFLNLYGLVGYIEGETEVLAEVAPQDIGFLIDYSGLVYGVGAILAGGWDAFFATLTGIITETDLDVSTSSVGAWVVSPRVGIRAGTSALWFGAMYQEAEEEHQGIQTVDVLGTSIPIQYDAQLEQDEPWNYLAGFSTVLWDSFELSIEGGFGDRKQVTASTKFRF